MHELTPLGNELINLAHVVRVFFTTDLDLKIHFAAMAEPRAGGGVAYAPTMDKPLVLTIKHGTREFEKGVSIFGMQEQLKGLEKEAKTAKEAKEREAEKKQGKKGKP